ncbi:hypothetical protein DFH06DRAFT_1135224 [Mycena polygramma]|nr:hypothetical protein DFH06DRAFT_1135224 [Mycena polygramma]
MTSREYSALGRSTKPSSASLESPQALFGYKFRFQPLAGTAYKNHRALIVCRNLPLEDSRLTTGVVCGTRRDPRLTHPKLARSQSYILLLQLWGFDSLSSVPHWAGPSPTMIQAIFKLSAREERGKPLYTRATSKDEFHGQAFRLLLSGCSHPSLNEATGIGRGVPTQRQPVDCSEAAGTVIGFDSPCPNLWRTASTANREARGFCINQILFAESGAFPYRFGWIEPKFQLRLLVWGSTPDGCLTRERDFEASNGWLKNGSVTVFVAAQKNYKKCAQKGKRKKERKKEKERFQASSPVNNSEKNMCQSCVKARETYKPEGGFEKPEPVHQNLDPSNSDCHNLKENTGIWKHPTLMKLRASAT